MFSKVYKRKEKSYVYDYDNALVCWVSPMGEQERADNKEWQERFGVNLYDEIVEDYYEVDSVGLRKENWENKEIRDEYLEGWELDIEEACQIEMAMEMNNM